MRQNGWFLKADLEKYFDSVHPENARRALRKMAIKQTAFRQGDLSALEWEQSLNSYQAWFSAYGTHALRKTAWQNIGLTA